MLKKSTDSIETQPIDIKKPVKVMKQTNFILPQKKPVSYKKTVSKNLLQSRILNARPVQGRKKYE